MSRTFPHRRPANETLANLADASLSEYFYQLRLVPDHTPTPRLGTVHETRTPRLSNKQRWGMLLVLVGLPYIRARMDDAYDRWSVQNDPELSLADQGDPLNSVSRLVPLIPLADDVRLRSSSSTRTRGSRPASRPRSWRTTLHTSSRRHRTSGHGTSGSGSTSSAGRTRMIPQPRSLFLPSSRPSSLPCFLCSSLRNGGTRPLRRARSRLRRRPRAFTPPFSLPAHSLSCPRAASLPLPPPLGPRTPPLSRHRTTRSAPPTLASVPSATGSGRTQLSSPPAGLCAGAVVGTRLRARASLEKLARASAQLRASLCIRASCAACLSRVVCV